MTGNIIIDIILVIAIVGIFFGAFRGWGGRR